MSRTGSCPKSSGRICLAWYVRTLYSSVVRLRGDVGVIAKVQQILRDVVVVVSTVACSYRVSSNVVRVILQAYPAAAAQPNGNGLYPLHLLCDHGCDVDSIQALLETPQGMSTLNVRDRIFQRPPLLLLNLRKNMGQFQEQLATMRDARARQRGMQQQQQLPLSRQDLTMDSEYQRLESMVTACRGVFWDKAALLLLAEYYQMPLVSSSLVNRRLVLHASVASRWCPPSLLEYAVLLHPDLLLERDPDGRVPLHLAARVGNATVLHDVLHANQEAAACRDNTGASPLSLAVQQATLKWSDGLGQLVEANVTALADLKGVERVVPELWSLLERRDVLFQAIRVHATMMGSY